MRNMEYEMARQLLNLANKIVKNRNQHLKELNITGEQADSLTYFYKNPKRSISDLKDYLHISHQTARGIVKRLEEKQFLFLSASETDGRYKTVFLTERGKIIMKRLEENGTHTGYQLLNGMSQDEQKNFSKLVSQALKNMQ